MTIYDPKSKRKVRELSHDEVVYLAGFFDGEGSVGIYKNHTNDIKRKSKYVLRLRVVNTNRDIIDWISATVGCGSVAPVKPFNKNAKPAWEWSIPGGRAVHLLHQLYPYLKIKKLQAEIAFQYGRTMVYGWTEKGMLESVTNIRDVYRQKMQQLNRRGSAENCGTLNSR